MGILGDLFKLADDIVSIPTDFIGLTNHYGKKRAKELAQRHFLAGKMTAEEYEKVLLTIDKQ